jgi:acylphosphatase
VSHSALQRRELYYSGHVQGVGFRYSTHRIALRYQVTGFVRNLPDRRVHLVVEGSKEEIDRFLGDLAEKMGAFIRNIVVDKMAPTGEFDSFCIRY